MLSLQQMLQSSTTVNFGDKFLDYLSERAIASHTPLTGTFELTPRCTLDCAMCYVHLKPEQMQRSELSTEQWIDIIDHACDAGMLFAKVTGGECMLHPGFKRICETLFNRGVIVSILTNGTLIDEETADWIGRYPVEVVQLSVYGSSPEAYAAVTGNPDAFAKVDRALTLLKERGIRFTTPITISKQLAPDFANIVNYCHSKGSLKVSISPNPFPARPETGRQASCYTLTLDEEVTLYKQYYDLVGIPYESCSLEPAAVSPNGSAASSGIACKAGKSSFSITWDGWMLPCSTLYWMKADLQKDGFANAWLDTQKNALEFRYPGTCVTCELRRFCYVCPIVHYDSGSQSIVFNGEVCQETRRLISEGLIK